MPWAAYTANNSLPSGELSIFIRSVHAALVRIASGLAATGTPELAAPVPAVSVRRSVTPNYLICLDDGRKFKSLRRHLTALGMTPEQHRTKWNLPSDYPMVAANYAAVRSALAKKVGLGLSWKRGDEPRTESAEKSKSARRRSRKAAA